MESGLLWCLERPKAGAGAADAGMEPAAPNRRLPAGGVWTGSERMGKFRAEEARVGSTMGYFADVGAPGIRQLAEGLSAKDATYELRKELRRMRPMM